MGGADADISVAESIAGCLRVIDGLTRGIAAASATIRVISYPGRGQEAARVRYALSYIR